jgi:large subunit ribosomal protein L21
MEAVIKTGGKQYRVKVGDVIYVEKLNADADATVKFDEVLMLDDQVGNPYVKGASVEGVVLKHGKQKKITIFTYKPKKSSTRRKQGHRQPYTKIEIKKING